MIHALLVAASVEAIRVSLNEKPLAVTAIVRRGHVLLPFRELFSALRARVSYNSRTHTVRALRGGDHVSFTVGTHDSVLRAGRVYVPVRYVSQMLGSRVAYDPVNRMVSILDVRAAMHAQRVARLAQAQRSNAVDAPATPRPLYTAPIPYATDNGDSAFAPFTHLYVPNNQYRYFPGERVSLVLSAPPGGSVFADVCGLGKLAFVNPPGTSQYFGTFTVPARLGNRYCPVTAYYTSAFGARRRIGLPQTIEFAAAVTPSPSPRPVPTTTPVAHRMIQPVGRRTPLPRPQG
ncbi:MAG: copper amine oxidase N-terminal domain-containing protein [Candidatus Eremiobacteraeota bacterium]|nr:copper amine oxidase N-terminal domain-containing protein [Candidatus Eremiobacteraeota bacterium]